MSSPAHPASIGSSQVTTATYQPGNDNPAALTSAPTQEEVEAAIKIQKVVRGHLSRRNSEKVLGISFSPRSSRPSSPRASVAGGAVPANVTAAANAETTSNGAVEAEPRK